MISGIGVRIELIDRGDPAAVDVTQAAMTMDNAWHNLDLSAIVPANASWIALRVEIESFALPDNIHFRKDGNTNAIAAPGLNVQVANNPKESQILVPCSAARFIEYKVSRAVPTINITVLGWISGTVIPAVPAGMYKVLYESDVLVNNTGDMLENDMCVVNVPGGLLGENGGIRIRASGRCMGNLGTKTYRFVFGPAVPHITFIVPADPANKDWTLEVTCHNRGAIDNQNWTDIFFDELTILQQECDRTTNMDTSGDLDLKLTAQNQNAADWAQLFHICIEVLSA